METVFGVILGTGGGRRDSHPPADPGRRQCNRGRMGAQSDAVANARRGPRTALLVRPIRLSRDVPVGPRVGWRSSPPLSSNPERTGNRRGSSGGRS
jgi:hypothetical protein